MGYDNLFGIIGVFLMAAQLIVSVLGARRKRKECTTVRVKVRMTVKAVYARKPSKRKR